MFYNSDNFLWKNDIFLLYKEHLVHKGLTMLSDLMPAMYLKCFVEYFSVFA